MFASTQPAPLHADGLDEFRVHAPAEVLALLRQLVDGNVILHVSAPDGSSYTTTLWAVDAARGKLSLSADDNSPQLQGLLDAGEVVVVAYLDAIKVQFDLTHLVLVRAAKSCALQADLPHELFRFQRRSSFRVRPASRHAPVARFAHPAQPAVQVELRVLDISLGGCALLLPGDVPPLGPGTRIDDVKITLDSDTRFDATLQLQHVTSLSNTGEGVRLGCALHRMSGDAQRALQRYIDQTQKRRRLLALD